MYDSIFVVWILNWSQHRADSSWCEVWTLSLVRLSAAASQLSKVECQFFQWVHCIHCISKTKACLRNITYLNQDQPNWRCCFWRPRKLAKIVVFRFWLLRSCYHWHDRVDWVSLHTNSSLSDFLFQKNKMFIWDWFQNMLSFLGELFWFIIWKISQVWSIGLLPRNP